MFEWLAQGSFELLSPLGVRLSSAVLNELRSIPMVSARHYHPSCRNVFRELEYVIDELYRSINSNSFLCIPPVSAFPFSLDFGLCRPSSLYARTKVLS